jgi:translation initiation factor 2-alpha kinase 4
LEGLAHIHSEDIIHRDLKPQNIFLSNKVCKIGDFGLIKMNDSLENMKVQREDCGSLQASPKADTPSKQQDVNVGAIGTQVFASPEQWEGNNEKFDFKSDIFSLGIVLLLLFHPVSTIMEELHVIKESKNGKLPAKLEKDLPEIARIIKKMLAVEPSDRPSLETISSSLKLPVEMNTEFSGICVFKREDSEAWNNRHFKLIGKNFYVFNNEHAKKAENVYLLSEWTVLLENNSDVTGTSLAYITLEDPMKLGCTFRMESCEQTNELFNHLRKYVS